MARGANKQFIEQRERFLQKNFILSPNIQSYMASKAAAAKTPIDRVPMVGVYDLRKDPSLDIRDHSGKKPDVYKLYLLEQRAIHNVGVITKYTNAIRAFYLPWDNGRSWTVSLTNPRVSHLNFQNAAKTRIDPAAIDDNIAAIHGIGKKPNLRKLEKNNYSDGAQKERGINPNQPHGYRHRFPRSRRQYLGVLLPAPAVEYRAQSPWPRLDRSEHPRRSPDPDHLNSAQLTEGNAQPSLSARHGHHVSEVR